MRRRALLLIAVVGAALGAAYFRRSPATEPSTTTGDAELAPDAMPAVRATTGADTGALAAHPQATTAPPKESEDQIRGRVVNEQGRPVPDARVLDVPSTVDAAFELEAVGREGLLVSDAVTDAEGRFTVAARGDTPTHTLIAQAAGTALGVAADVTLGGPARVVTIVVGRGFEMRGIVVDADSKPLGRASVRVDGVLDVLHVRFEATTGADGRYRIDALPVAAERPGSGRRLFRALVEVRADGFAPLLQRAETSNDAGDVVEQDYVLSRGSTLEGTVVEAGTPKPVAGAKVVLWSIEGAGLEPGFVDRTPTPFAQGVTSIRWAKGDLPGAPRVLAESTSDSGGAFRFDHVPGLGFHAVLDPAMAVYRRLSARVGYVLASAPGHATAQAAVEAVAASERREVRLELALAGAIEGRVVLPAGVGAESVRIAVVRNSDSPIGSGLTEFADRDGDGRFTDRLPPIVSAGQTLSQLPWRATPRSDGRFRIDDVAQTTEGGEATVVAALSSTSPTTPALVASAVVAVRAGETTNVPDLVLAPLEASVVPTLSRFATLRVVDEDGRPVWGAWARSVDWSSSEALADREGVARLAVDVLDPSAESIRVAAGHAGFASRLATLPLSGADREPVRVALRAGHRVSGRVLEADGQYGYGTGIIAVSASIPVDQVLHESDRKTVRLGRRFFMVVGDDLFPLDWVIADGDGRFVVEDLPAGPYHVGAMLTSDVWFESHAAEAVVPGIATDTTDVLVVLGAPHGAKPGWLAGSVRDATTGAPPRTLRVEIRLSSGRSVYATTADARALGPPPGSAVQVSLAGPGRFRFDSLPTGTHRLSVTSEGYSPKSLDVTIEADRKTEMPPIDLVRGVVVHGQVRRSDGEAFEDGSYVTAVPVSVREAHQDPALRTAAVAPDGRFELAGLSSGRWRVCVASDGAVFVATERPLLEVPADAVEVTWERTMKPASYLSVGSSDARLPIRGSATDEQRKFSAGCEVDVLDERGEVVAEQRGGFLRADTSSVSSIVLPAGTYTVRTKVAGESPTEQRVTVGAAQPATEGGPPSTAGSVVHVTFGEKPQPSTGACGAGKCG